MITNVHDQGGYNTTAQWAYIRRYEQSTKLCTGARIIWCMVTDVCLSSIVDSGEAVIDNYGNLVIQPIK